MACLLSSMGVKHPWLKAPVAVTFAIFVDAPAHRALFGDNGMPSDLINSIATVVGVIVAVLGAFFFAFWIAMGIWTFNDIRARSRDWLVMLLASVLVLVFPIVGLILYLMIRPKHTLAEVYDRALEEEALLREIEETLVCSTCGIPVKEAWVYCPNCHNQLQHSCINCKNLVRNEWEICVFCGTAQQTARQPSTAFGQTTPAAAQAQRTNSSNNNSLFTRRPGASPAANGNAAPQERQVVERTAERPVNRAAAIGNLDRDETVYRPASISE